MKFRISKAATLLSPTIVLRHRNDKRDIEDAMAGYLAEPAQVRTTLDSRYDEIKSGRVRPIDGEEAFNRLRNKSKDRRRS